MALLANPTPVTKVAIEALGESVAVVAVEGRLTWSSSAELVNGAVRVRREGRHEIVLDLSAVDEVDAMVSMTLRALPGHLDGCEVVVAAQAPEAVIAVSHATEAADWPLRSTRAEALALLLSRPVAAF